LEELWEERGWITGPERGSGISARRWIDEYDWASAVAHIGVETGMDGPARALHMLREV